MNVILELPSSSGEHNGIWIIVNSLTKITQFVSIKAMFTLDQLAKLYVEKVVS